MIDQYTSVFNTLTERLMVSVAPGITPEQEAEARDMISVWAKRQEGLSLNALERRYNMVISRFDEGWSDKTVRYDMTPRMPGELRSEQIDPDFPTVIRQYRWFDTPEGASKSIPQNNNWVYRGMSLEEWLFIKQRKVIRSLGTYNFIEQQGQTYFGDRVDTAISYAGGFAPWQFRPTRDTPGAVIAIPKELATQNPISSGEYYVEGELPAKHIKAAWMLVVTEFKDGYIELIKDRRGNVSEGSRKTPYAQYAFVPVEV